MKTYGETLRELRKRAGYSLVQAAKELRNLGVTATNTGISRWENGYNNPTLEQFLGLCNLYGVRDVADVFENGGIEDMETDINHDGLVLLQHFQDILSRNPRYQRITPGGASYPATDHSALPPGLLDGGKDQGEPRVRRHRPEGKRRYVVQILPQKEVNGTLVDPYAVPIGGGRGGIKGPRARQIKCYEIGPAAGKGNFMEDSPFEMITLAPNAPSVVDYAVRVSGDSMMPLLANGQMLYVHDQPDVEDGETGIFSLNGDAYVKQFRNVDGVTWLVSANPKYDPIRVEDTDDLVVLGKVVSPRVNPQAIPLPRGLRPRRRKRRRPQAAKQPEAVAAEASVPEAEEPAREPEETQD